MKIARWPGLLTAITLSLWAAGAVAEAGTRPLSILFPGEGMGNILLGSSGGKALNLLGWGKPSEMRQDESRSEYYLIYKSQGVHFTFKTRKEDKHSLSAALLAEIQVFSPAYIVAGSGLKIGDIWVEGKTMNEGSCKKSETPGEFLCPSEGIAFQLGNTMDVRSIRIITRR